MTGSVETYEATENPGSDNAPDEGEGDESGISRPTPAADGHGGSMRRGAQRMEGEIKPRFVSNSY